MVIWEAFEGVQSLIALHWCERYNVHETVKRGVSFSSL